MIKASCRFVTTLCCLTALLQVAPATELDLPVAPYGVGAWDARQFGNHRAVVAVAASAPAVRVQIPWRRRDAQPDRKQIIVTDADGNAIANVARIEVSRARGDVVFEPTAGAGTYYLYYLPFRMAGRSYCPTTIYLPVTDTAAPAWREQVEAQLAAGTALPQARLVQIQAAGEFDRFDPMEVIATAGERRRLAEAHADAPFLVFPEDRRHGIRMQDDLPVRWVQRGPSRQFQGQARPNEYYAFQLGVWAHRQGLTNLRARWSAFRGPQATIGADAATCFHQQGIDWLGRAFSKQVEVPPGQVQPLWFGLQVPPDAPVGTYTGTITLTADGGAEQAVPVTIQVAGTALEDHGDADLWRLARLRWLNSRIGLDDEVPAGYLPVTLAGDTLSILGRNVEIGPDGLPTQLVSHFNDMVDGFAEPGKNLLAAPMRFVVETAAGAARWQDARCTWSAPRPARQDWRAQARTTNGLRYDCQGYLESDGYLDIKLTLTAETEVTWNDARLELTLPAAAVPYLMGMKHRGGRRPDRVDWQWDGSVTQMLWLGDVNGGLQLRLDHEQDIWEISSLGGVGLPDSWANDGRGGATLTTRGDLVHLRAYSGPRQLPAGTERVFRFSLLLTPFKLLDQDHWKWRYVHDYHDLWPLEEIVTSGATIRNLHHCHLMPNLNYPFTTADRLAAYIDRAKQMGVDKVKIYYTVRELSCRVAELWALRSLGDEIFRVGPGFLLADQFETDRPDEPLPATGSAWLCEHLVDDYVPAWHDSYPEIDDATIATQGLSRWHNYYLEGLGWLIRNVGIDGLYLDGIGYDREVMKRLRKTMDRARPGCLLDFHSGDNFSERYGWGNPAGVYLEHFPYLDSLWFGEGFDYDAPPDVWLTEISGLPFGLFGEMLQGGGNPYRGMIYGMSNRLRWQGDPRSIWRLWELVDIESLRMMGYWSAACPVRCDDPDVRATAYVGENHTLICLASWAEGLTAVTLQIDWELLGLDPDRAVLQAPFVEGLQQAFVFSPADALPVAPGRGWFLVATEHPLAESGSATNLKARAFSWDGFAAADIGRTWQPRCSSRPDTTISVADDVVRLTAAANSVAFLERPLPAGAVGVAACVARGNDQGATWGPGVALIWPDGAACRVNLRADGKFGVYDSRDARLLGTVLGGEHAWYYLRLELADDDVVVWTSDDGGLWKELARISRAGYHGDPVAVGVGKMGFPDVTQDYREPGPAGTGKVRRYTIY